MVKEQKGFKIIAQFPPGTPINFVEFKDKLFVATPAGFYELNENGLALVKYKKDKCNA